MQDKMIAASILAADYSRLGEQIKESAAAGVSWFHVDIMDGRYVPCISFGADFASLVGKHAEGSVCDVHIMAKQPENHINAVLAAGADYVTFHPDATTRAQHCLSQIRSSGVKAGFALSPAISVSAVESVVDQLDMILIMTVEPGFGGQRLIESMLRKVEAARKLAGDEIRIQVDGGVGAENIAALAAAGADTFVVGSSFYKNNNLDEAYSKLATALG